MVVVVVMVVVGSATVVLPQDILDTDTVGFPLALLDGYCFSCASCVYIGHHL